MAARKILIAAGVLKPRTGDTSSSRPHTATEHATPPNTNTATEHVTSPAPGPPTGPPMYGEHATSSNSPDDGTEILTLLGDADMGETSGASGYGTLA